MFKGFESKNCVLQLMGKALVTLIHKNLQIMCLFSKQYTMSNVLGIFKMFEKMQGGYEILSN